MFQSSANSPIPEGESRAGAPGAGLKAGQRLAAARRKAGLSLEEMAARTRVRREFLEALEMMDVKLLPGRAYSLAYLRSYASALGLDPRELSAQFERESALTREDPQPQLRNPESKPRPHRPWLAALGVAAAAAAFIGWRVWTAEEPAVAAASSAPTAAVGAPAAAAAAPDVALASSVELYALQPAWLEVRGPDGTIFLSRTLRAGERYRPEVGAGWTLHAHDGGAFEAYVDGVSIGALSKPGAPVLGRPVDALPRQALATR